MNLAVGLDRLLEEPGALAGRRFGLLAHGASVTRDLTPAHLALAAAGATPHVLFGPEHGYYGVEQDMVPAADSVDPWTGAPVRSLYGTTEGSLRPETDAFRGLDLLVVDLQDVGSRYYTYVATAVWAAEAALAAGCEVWVLDRPNPLGDLIEGNRRGEGFESFVGAFPTPVRHGATLAELVRWRTGATESDGLRCWAVEGWSPGDSWPATRRPWIAPSPNMPSYATAALYPGLCLLEATRLSEGRGTTRPFHLLGAPHLAPRELAEAIRDLGFAGVRALPTYFRPQFQKHAGAVCGGVELVVTDADALDAYRFGVSLLELLWLRSDPETFWRDEPYEFVSDRPAVDLLAGTSELRERLERGDSLDPWIETWTADEVAWREELVPFAIYPRGSSPAGGR